jgi:hypothetical protein
MKSKAEGKLTRMNYPAFSVQIFKPREKSTNVCFGNGQWHPFIAKAPLIYRQ